jgi:uncharacterized membrane protein
MPSPKRLSEIDITRGFVMVLMALDHTRDFFGDHSIDALDVVNTNVPLFFARWLTHLCAPTFVFLAGISVALARAKEPRWPLGQLAVRGLWLVLLEQTFLRCFGWYFNFDYHFVNAGILWGTGWAMVLLAGILALRLPSYLVGILGFALMVGHSFLAGAVGSSWWGTLLLRSDELLPAPGWHFYVSYPVLPWFGVMAFGYGAGEFIRTQSGFDFRLKRTLIWCGIGMAILFVLLRVPNLLDPDPWSIQARPGFTVLSFINTEKYPPSLPFLLMTLGPMLVFMALASFLPKFVQRSLLILGRVPLFFYLAHIVLIHLLAVLLAFSRFGHAEWLYQGPGIFWSETLPGHPPGYGLGLGWVTVIWLLVTALLWPVCRWYGWYKQSHGAWWLNYL